MKKVRIPGSIIGILAGAAAFLAALGALMLAIPDAGASAGEAVQVLLLAALALIALVFVLGCNLDYDEEIVRRRTVLGWRTLRLSEIDRLQRSGEDILLCAGKRRMRYTIFADDEGDLPGLVDRLAKERGVALPCVPTPFSCFSERLYCGKLRNPEQFLLLGIALLAAGPVISLSAAVSGEWLRAAEIAGFGFAVFGAMAAAHVFVVRRAERFPRLVRWMVRPWALRRNPGTEAKEED